MANLTQLRMLEKLDGYLLVDKPAGIAFSSVVKAVKRKFNLVKVGHGGSLDAMASGLLILLIGDANKFVGDVMGADREYTGTMRLGLATNTHDIYGVPVEQASSPFVEQASSPFVEQASSPAQLQEKIDSTLPDFTGDVFQTESRYCSVRKEGSAQYEIADTGDHTQFLAHVYRFKVGAGEKSGSLAFELKASKGVLVKTLVNDFGAALGCGAALETLRRTRIGKYAVGDAIPFDRLLETEMGDFASVVMPLSKALA